MDKSPQDSETLNKNQLERGAHVRPVLIVITVAALVSGPLLILEQIWPKQPWRLLLLFLILVTVQSVLTTLWQNRPNFLTSSFRIRAAELIVILFVLRIITWFITDSIPSRSDYNEILQNPGSLLDGFFSMAAVMTIFVVFWSQNLTRLFAKLSLEQSELPKPRKTRGTVLLADDPTRIFTDRQAIMQRYYRDWVIGGAILIVCAAISTFDFVDYTVSDSWIRSLRNITRIGLRPVMLIALLAYFLGGFLLASEGRLAMLKARWTYDGVTIERQVITSWRRYSVILLVIISLIAVLVPIGSTVDISIVFQAVSWIAILLLGLLLSILAAIYYVIYTLLFSPMEDVERPPLSFEEIVPEVPQIVAQPNDIAALIVGGLIWVIVVAAIVIAIVYLVRNKGLPLEHVNIFNWWRGFVLWLRQQWRRISSHVQTISKELRSTLPTLDRPLIRAPDPWRFIRLRSLSPRDRIRYFYLSAVKRAGDQGIVREDGATPSEYVSDLKGEWPVVSAEIEELTNAFVKARYSDDSIHESDVDSVKPIWKRVRAALRR